MTKGELIKRAYGNDNTGGVDCSIPQAVFDNLLRIGINPTFYVMSYKEEDKGENGSRFGVLVNLAEKILMAEQNKPYKGKTSKISP